MRKSNKSNTSQVLCISSFFKSLFMEKYTNNNIPERNVGRKSVKLNSKPKSHSFLLQKTINMIVPDRNKEIESTILKTLKYQIFFYLIALWLFKKITKNSSENGEKGSIPVEWKHSQPTTGLWSLHLPRENVASLRCYPYHHLEQLTFCC